MCNKTVQTFQREEGTQTDTCQNISTNSCDSYPEIEELKLSLENGLPAGKREVQRITEYLEMKTWESMLPPGIRWEVVKIMSEKLQQWREEDLQLENARRVKLSQKQIKDELLLFHLKLEKRIQNRSQFCAKMVQKKINSNRLRFNNALWSLWTTDGEGKEGQERLAKRNGGLMQKLRIKPYVARFKNEPKRTHPTACEVCRGLPPEQVCQLFEELALSKRRGLQLLKRRQLDSLHTTPSVSCTEDNHGQVNLNQVLLARTLSGRTYQTVAYDAINLDMLSDGDSSFEVSVSPSLSE